MSWGLGWKRPSEIFHLTLNYGTDDFADNYTPRSSASSRSSSSSSITSSQDPQDQQLGFRIDLDWNAVDDEDQVALRLQSQVMVALPLPQDTVEIELKENSESEGNVREWVEMSVVKRREPLKVVITNGLGTMGWWLVLSIGEVSLW